MNNLLLFFLVVFLFLACSDSEKITPVKPVIAPVQIPVKPPLPDSLVVLDVDYKTDLLPNTATPELEFQRGLEPAGEYLYRATVNIHQLGGDIQNLDILLYHGQTLVLSDRFEIKDTVGHIFSISLARHITAPAFNKAYVRVTNEGDSISYGVEVKRISIEPFL